MARRHRRYVRVCCTAVVYRVVCIRMMMDSCVLRNLLAVDYLRKYFVVCITYVCIQRCFFSWKGILLCF